MGAAEDLPPFSLLRPGSLDAFNNIVSAITWHLPSLAASFHWKYLHSSMFPRSSWYNFRENSWVLGKEIINVVLSTAWRLYTTKLISCSKHQKQSAWSRQKEELPGWCTEVGCCMLSCMLTLSATRVVSVGTAYLLPCICVLYKTFFYHCIYIINKIFL